MYRPYDPIQAVIWSPVFTGDTAEFKWFHLKRNSEAQQNILSHTMHTVDVSTDAMPSHFAHCLFALIEPLKSLEYRECRDLIIYICSQ